MARQCGDGLVTMSEMVANAGRIAMAVKTRALLGFEEAIRLANASLEAGAGMGYKLAILPVLLFNAVVRVCDKMLDELKQTRRHPMPVADVASKEFFRRMGAEEWDAVIQA